MSGTRVAFVLQLLCQILLATDRVAANNMYGTPRKVLPDGYLPFEEIGVAYKYFPERTFWDDARMKCMYDGGQLAAIDSERKVLSIMSMRFPDYPGAIHAGIRRSPGAYWTTADGSPISEETVPWWPGKPSGEAGCTILNKRNGHVYNMECTRQWPFVCEIPLDLEDSERSSDNRDEDTHWETTIQSTVSTTTETYETSTTEKSPWSWWG